jgi:signal transduction histidine kinase
MPEKADVIIEAVIVISAIFTAVAMFVIAYVVYFKRRKTSLIAEQVELKKELEQQLLKSQIEVQEHTFQQIGRELHDNVGQLLSTSRMLLGLTEMNLANPPDTLKTANATLAQAIQELRSLSKSLDQDWLQQFSFTDNLKTEITRINATDIVKAEFDHSGSVQLSANEQILLFRIVQEAIQNAIKHAEPKHISISVKQDQSNLYITIKDDGRGFTSGAQPNGLGIANMKHRTTLLGGNITWHSQPGNGTKVGITLPVKDDQHEKTDGISG